MIVVDIETVPLDEAMKAEYPEAERNPPGNITKAETIAKWREADRVKWADDRAKECSLNPRLGRVLCIGLAGDIEKVVIAPEEKDEATAIAAFWDAVGDNPFGQRIVTWNGAWDLRFLVIRSLALNVPRTVAPETVNLWFAKYRTSPHFDAKAVLLNWENGYRVGEGLDEWARFLGVHGKSEGISGKDVYPMYQLGHFAEIAEYCAADVAATKAIYSKIAPMFAGGLI